MVAHMGAGLQNRHGSSTELSN